MYPDKAEVARIAIAGASLSSEIVAHHKVLACLDSDETT
jgi:hypothetical protein